MNNVEDRKKLFLKLLKDNCLYDDFNKDPEDIVAMLDIVGYFTVPASTKYHGNYEGGLFDHCFNVYSVLSEMSECLPDCNFCNSRSPFVIGMFHDLCKCDSYIKVGDSYQYNTKQLITTDHGTKSILLIQHLLGINLTEEEFCCIRYHMGAYKLGEESDVKNEWNAIDRAIRKYSTVLWTHTADMYASKVVEE